MPVHLPHLDRQALHRLRNVARQLRGPSRRALPIRELVDLAAEIPLGPDVTIDFEASRDLGDALVVLRVPDPRRQPPDRRLAGLSRREREVAELVTRGLSNKQIANRLGIATGTVKDHLHSIFRKTALPNRAAIAAACKGPSDHS